MMISAGFLFGGSGGQYPKMGAVLYVQDATFRSGIDECAYYVDRWLPSPLAQTMFDTGTDAILARIDYMSVGLFAIQYALVRYWQANGLRLHAALAHSLGAHAAACAAEAIDCEEACRLLEARCRSIGGQCAAGAMGVAEETEAFVIDHMREIGCEAEIAAVNGKRWTTFSGRTDDVVYLIDSLIAHGIRARRHPISHAFHSSLMDAALPSYAASIRSIPSRRPSIPLFTTTAGAVDRVCEAFWLAQLRAPMRFAPAYRQFRAAFAGIVIEVGPADAFCRFAAEVDPVSTIVPSLSQSTQSICVETLRRIRAPA
ncbi:UNVERIFIED_ORG: acyl transferase domain-containing protein [Burkholderia contaminans]|nr:acyl transferase domain-containing protein [Burkholderia contaminans]